MSRTDRKGLATNVLSVVLLLVIGILTVWLTEWWVERQSQQLFDGMIAVSLGMPTYNNCRLHLMISS